MSILNEYIEVQRVYIIFSDISQVGTDRVRL